LYRVDKIGQEFPRATTAVRQGKEHAYALCANTGETPTP
jgi:hypothetical protein